MFSEAPTASLPALRGAIRPMPLQRPYACDGGPALGTCARDTPAHSRPLTAPESRCLRFEREDMQRAWHDQKRPLSCLTAVETPKAL